MKYPPISCPASEGIPLLAPSAVTIPPALKPSWTLRYHTSCLSSYTLLPCAVRNIPDINQILSKEKCWNQVDKCSTGGAKFDREFPPLSGEKKNQNSEKTDFYGNWNNLTSRQAPATLCKPPASLPPAQWAPAAQPAACKLPHKPPSCCQSPARLPAASQPASHPPTRLPASCLPTPSPSGPTASSQAPCPSQSEAIIPDSQSKKYLNSGHNLGNNFCPAEGMGNQNSASKNNHDPSKNRPNQVSKDKNNLTSSHWDSEGHNTCLGLDPSQTNLSKPKIDLESPMSLSHQLTSQPGDIIGSRMNGQTSSKLPKNKNLAISSNPISQNLYPNFWDSCPLFFTPTYKSLQVGSTINKGSPLSNSLCYY
ncbi:hypothetical protein DSO57_1027274 [Entomophthora muscae]|uniref:Uncharacterized protein n=1 Tax=Entomophthora muscae TaxID=34485 RepID=A0ACC2SR73_9FUNG|nr:hypothetical protein DSO57_1027274 [Entomophthora muscae]